MRKPFKSGSGIVNVRDLVLCYDYLSEILMLGKILEQSLSHDSTGIAAALFQRKNRGVHEQNPKTMLSLFRQILMECYSYYCIEESLIATTIFLFFLTIDNNIKIFAFEVKIAVTELVEPDLFKNIV